MRGAISVGLDDGRCREEVRLDHPSLGVHIPPLVWAVQYRHTPDAMLLVFASHHYNSDDYIRDHDSFLKTVAEARLNDALTLPPDGSAPRRAGPSD